MHESQSEVVRLREQITWEYEAAQRGLSGTAITASHQFITAHMERMWEHLQELTQLVGAAEACALVFGEAETATQEGRQP
jgi:tRNA C32,U32 (ribose-2'-O)-methylase TrmJ